MKNLFKSIKPFMIKHEPEFLMAMGLSGMIFGTCYTIKATKKVCEIDTSNLTKKQKLKLYAKCYWPVAVTLGLSTACIIAGNRESNKRTTALATAVSVSEKALEEYQQKTLELVGPKKEQAIHEAVSADQITQTYPNSSKEIILTGDGDSLFYEPLSGRYFRTNWNKILRAANELNADALTSIDGTITLTEWFDKLGLSKTDISDAMGWTILNGPNGLINVTIDSAITKDNEPCGAIYYVNRPNILA